MSFTQYLLLVLLSLPGAYHDKETWDERIERMETVARAIDDVSSQAVCAGAFDKPDCEKVWPGSKKSLAMLLVTKAWWESRIARNVHEGKCRKFECDAVLLPGGDVIHRARTPWQIQQTGMVKPKEWTTMVGTGFKPTRTAAWVATRVMASAYKRCHHVMGAIAGYATASCTWSGAGVRYTFWQKLMAKTERQFAEDAEKRKRDHEERDREIEEALATRSIR